MPRSITTLILLLLLASVRPAFSSSLDHSGKDEAATTTVVVKLKPSSGASINAINATYRTRTLETLLGSAGIYLVQVPPGQAAKRVADAMRNDGRIVYAEPNYDGEAPEGDPSSIKGWGGADATPFTAQYAAHALNLSAAHALNRGAGTVVAVLDTGVQLDHPALAQSITEARYDFVQDDAVPNDEFNGVDDDGDKVIDEVAGHGTHVAGIVHLVAPNARIMPLRVLDSDGHGNLYTVAEAIAYAVDHGAHVINLSLGTAIESDLLEDMIRSATQRGVVVVAAAGNQNSETKQYPAVDQCALAVTAVDQSRKKATFANFNGEVDVAAPGQSIYSTFPPSGYAWWSGTSMATPFVAGQAALLRSANPSLGVREVAAIVAATAQNIDQHNPKFAGRLGVGEPDIGASVALAVRGHGGSSGNTPVSGGCTN